ncbi:MAG TPA: branched-chain amino acid ABC transporter permease [Candidatus Deferrimicrobium sp.]|nr:branched-chain amino acid ABC transporter permease [Candidatus Deferrimicrobium sp.]
MKRHQSKLYLLAGLAAAAIISAFESSMSPYYYQVAIYIGINIVLALSLNIINGFAGQFSLGHAGFMALGAYTSAVITTSLGIEGSDITGILVFALALVCGGCIASLFGLLVGVPSLRLKGDYLAITTLGFGEIIRVIIQNLDFLGAARGFTGIPKLSNFLWVFGAAGILAYTVANLINSTYGKGFIAVRDDEVAAASIGINTTRYKVIAFVTGAFFAGIAGGLYAHFITYINPSQFGFLKSFEIVVMVVVGGMGSFTGVILSAILLTILPEALRGIAQYRMVMYALLLVIIMLSRPQGLFARGLRVKRYLKQTPAAT